MKQRPHVRETHGERMLEHVRFDGQSQITQKLTVSQRNFI